MEIFAMFGRILMRTDEAEKSIQKTESKAKQLVTVLGSGIKTAAKWGAGLVAGAAAAATAAVGALLKADEATAEYRENMAKLNSTWEASGKGADLAKKAYQGLYGVMGDQDAATEASQLLAEVADGAKGVADWTGIAAGVSSRWGSSLPIESLIEAANESQKLGVVTGALSDALVWAGINEEEFNKKLAACGSEQERNELITKTLKETYKDYTKAFGENNAEALKSRNAQLKAQDAMAKLGGAVAAVKTALTVEFAPALANIVSSFVDFIQGVDGAEEALQESVGKMIDLVVSKLPDFLNFGVDIIVAIAKGLIQNLPYLLKQLPNIVGAIVDGLAELGGELFNVGKELLGQLWAGAKAVWNDITAWFKEKNPFDWDIPSDDNNGGGRGPGFSHAAGLPYVPYDNYPANLHRDEVVLTPGGAKTLLDDVRAITAGTGGRAEQVIHLTIELDGDVVARKTYKHNQAEAERRGPKLVTT